MRCFLGTLLLALGLAACSPEPERMNEMTIYPDAEPIAPFTECRVTTAEEPSLGADHVAVCDPLMPAVFPPTSGTHFSSWADFGTYDAPVPWGFLVHAMEHGAVVVGYRCEAACPELVSELQAIIDAQPADPMCRGDDAARFILVPMPDLVEPIAVLAWEHLYLATCLDRPSMEAFMTAHYAQAPEDFCNPGTDRAASGWCP